MQFLLMVVMLGVVGSLAIRLGRSLDWISTILAWAAAIFLLARPRKVGRPAKRHSREAPWMFPIAVVAVMAACFSATLFWSDLHPALSAGLQQLASKGAETASRLAGSTAAPSSEDLTFSCHVTEVHDGDTFRCADGARVRLHAVAARELDGTCSPGHPCPAASATSARAALDHLAGGQTIQCLRTGKSYDRVTAICWTSSGREINCAMVRSGTTLLWDNFNRQSEICRGF
ncbi:thermonuclease family protein [Phenylobacterium koreense]|uniref:Endonuclease YncB(Thermonuclease family) n=1 Tax=Phenylobacterium koreense TaxID=266125 RepID=A0ABV2ELT4_9CAUL